MKYDVTIFSFFLAFMGLMVLCGCKTSSSGTGKITTTEYAEPSPKLIKAPELPSFGGKPAIPRATLYKTNGNYDQNVVANYDSQSGTFISFPAPTDVSSDSSPLVMNGGWLLDRRGGVGATTVFLRWTYAEYHELANVPSIDELRHAIIPNARVTEMVQLNITSYAAQRDTAEVNRIIESGNLQPITFP